MPLKFTCITDSQMSPDQDDPHVGESSFLVVSKGVAQRMIHNYGTK